MLLHFKIYFFLSQSIKLRSCLFSFHVIIWHIWWRAINFQSSVFVFFVFFQETFYRKCAHLGSFNIAIKFEKFIFNFRLFWLEIDNKTEISREKQFLICIIIFIIFTSRLLVSGRFTPFCHNFSSCDLFIFSSFFLHFFFTFSICLVALCK
jgi:hypothetical protein